MVMITVPADNADFAEKYLRALARFAGNKYVCYIKSYYELH